MNNTVNQDKNLELNKPFGTPIACLTQIATIDPELIFIIENESSDHEVVAEDFIKTPKRGLEIGKKYKFEVIPVLEKTQKIFSLLALKNYLFVGAQGLLYFKELCPEYTSLFKSEGAILLSLDKKQDMINPSDKDILIAYVNQTMIEITEPVFDSDPSGAFSCIYVGEEPTGEKFERYDFCLKNLEPKETFGPGTYILCITEL